MRIAHITPDPLVNLADAGFSAVLRDKGPQITPHLGRPKILHVAISKPSFWL